MSFDAILVVGWAKFIVWLSWEYLRWWVDILENKIIEKYLCITSCTLIIICTVVFILPHRIKSLFNCLKKYVCVSVAWIQWSSHNYRANAILLENIFQTNGKHFISSLAWSHSRIDLVILAWWTRQNKWWGWTIWILMGFFLVWKGSWNSSVFSCNNPYVKPTVRNEHSVKLRMGL